MYNLGILDLRAKFCPDRYGKQEFDGQGHPDCWVSEGASARGSVFDRVKRKVDAVCIQGKPALPLRRGQKFVCQGEALHGDGVVCNGYHAESFISSEL